MAYGLIIIWDNILSILNFSEYFLQIFILKLINENIVFKILN